MTKSKPPEYIRKRRRAEKRKGQEQSEPKATRKMILEILGVVGTLASVAGILLGILSLIPRLSVQASGSVRSHDPLGTVFELSNDSVLPIHDVVASCVPDVEVGGISLKDVPILTPEGKAAVLSSGQKMTLGCHRIMNTEGFDIHEMKMKIFVTYRPDFLWWKRYVQFQMEGLKAQDGTWIWKRIAQ